MADERPISFGIKPKPPLQHAVHPSGACGWWMDPAAEGSELVGTWLPDWLRAEAKRLEEGTVTVLDATKKRDAA